MMVKPEEHRASNTKGEASPNPQGFAVAVSGSEEVQSIRYAVHKALAGERMPVSPYITKFSPGIDRAKEKPVAKPKPPVSNKRRKSKPKSTGKVDLRPKMDDAIRHALWWEFHMDISQGEYPKWRGSPPVSVDISDTEKERRQQESFNSSVIRLRLNNVRAYGKTPVGDQPGNVLYNHIPHPAKREEFRAATRAHQWYRDYQRELVNRYVVSDQVGKAIPGLRDAYDFIKEPPTVLVASYESSNSEDTIELLEQHLSQDGNPARLVKAVQNGNVLYEEAVAAMTRHVFDMDESPSAANDPTYVSDTHVDGQDQSYSLRGAVATFEREQIYDLDLYAYNKWLRDNEHREVSLLEAMPIPTEAALKAQQDDIDSYEGARYNDWLFQHKSSLHLREYMESVRLLAEPGYNPKLGEYAHELSLGHPKAFDRMVKMLSSRRLALIEHGIIMPNSSINEWCDMVNAAFPTDKTIPKSYTGSAQIAMEDSEERKRGIIAENESFFFGDEEPSRKLPVTLETVSRAEEMWKSIYEGNANVIPMEDVATIEGEYSVLSASDDPLMLDDTPPWDDDEAIPTDLLPDESPVQEGAEVVNIADHLSKRTERVQRLVNISPEKLRGLSEEDINKIVSSINTVNDILNNALR